MQTPQQLHTEVQTHQPNLASLPLLTSHVKYLHFFRSVLSARQSSFAARSSLWAGGVWRLVVHSSLFHQREHALTSPAVEASLFLSSLCNVGPPGPHGLSCNYSIACVCVLAWDIPHMPLQLNVPLSSLSPSFNQTTPVTMHFLQQCQLCYDLFILFNVKKPMC